MVFQFHLEELSRRIVRSKSVCLGTNCCTCCCVFSGTGVVFLFILGLLMQKQPEFIPELEGETIEHSGSVAVHLYISSFIYGLFLCCSGHIVRQRRNYADRKLRTGNTLQMRELHSPLHGEYDPEYEAEIAKENLLVNEGVVWGQGAPMNHRSPRVEIQEMKEVAQDSEMVEDGEEDKNEDVLDDDLSSIVDEATLLRRGYIRSVCPVTSRAYWYNEETDDSLYEDQIDGFTYSGGTGILLDDLET
eukprot:g1252.t1